MELMVNFFLILESKFSKRNMAIGYMFFSCIAFTTLNTLTKLTSDVPSFQLTYVRGMFEMFFSMIVLTYIEGDFFSKNRQTQKLLFVRGSLGGMSLLLYVYALYHIPISICASLFMMTPLWIGIVTCIKDKHINQWNFVFMAISFFAMLLIIKPSNNFEIKGAYEENNEIRQYISFCFALFNGMIAGVIYFTIKNLQGKTHLATIVFYLNFFNTIFSGLAQFYQGTIKLTFYHYFKMFCMAAAGWTGQMLRSRALILDKVFFISVLLYIQIVVAYFGDIFILGIDLDIYSVLGCFLIGVSMTGLIIMDKNRR